MSTSMQNPIPPEVQIEFLRANTVTQLVVLVVLILVLMGGVLWIVNRVIKRYDRLLDNQERQLAVIEKNSETSAKNAASLRELTDTVSSSSTDLKAAAKLIGDLGKVQGDTNELITSKAKEATDSILAKLDTMDRTLLIIHDTLLLLRNALCPPDVKEPPPAEKPVEEGTKPP